MSDWFDKHYDEDLAFALYSLYEAGDDSVLNDLLTELCPLVRKCFRVDASKSEQGDQGFLEAEALNAVYELLKLKDIPVSHERVFTKYVSTVVLRTFRDTRVYLRTQTFDYWKVARSPYGSSFASAHEVEADIYRTQITKLLRESVKSKLRFIGVDRDACSYILDCELGYKNLYAETAKRKYGLTSLRCKYLIKYVTVLLRAALWEFGENEHKDGPLASDWSAGRGILRTPSELW